MTKHSAVFSLVGCLSTILMAFRSLVNAKVVMTSYYSFSPLISICTDSASLVMKLEIPVSLAISRRVTSSTEGPLYFNYSEFSSAKEMQS